MFIWTLIWISVNEKSDIQFSGRRMMLVKKPQTNNPAVKIERGTVMIIIIDISELNKQVDAISTHGKIGKSKI